MTRLAIPLSVGLVAAASLATGLLNGATEIPPGALLGHLFSDDGSVADAIVDRVRVPRVLSAFAVGGLLALAGALIQILLRNPLGDPYVLGVSGGAAAGMLGAMLLGLSPLLHTPLALVGALVSTLLVFGLAGRRNDWHSDRLLLTGIVIATGWGALISLILSLSPPARLPGMLFWLIGDLSGAGSPVIPWLVLAVALVAALSRARELDIATGGMLQAAALGVDTRRLRAELYFLAALLTAAAVAVAGTIGFVGLITPHLVRRLGVTDHRRLLPTAVLAGGALLVLADAASRSLVSPMQLPVGVLTALIGVPAFLVLLQRGERR